MYISGVEIIAVATESDPWLPEPWMRGGFCELLNINQHSKPGTKRVFPPSRSKRLCLCPETDLQSCQKALSKTPTCRKADTHFNPPHMFFRTSSASANVAETEPPQKYTASADIPVINHNPFCHAFYDTKKSEAHIDDLSPRHFRTALWSIPAVFMFKILRHDQ